MSTGNLSRLDPEEVAKAVTDFINATIMARSRPVRPDDDLELAGLDSMALLKVLLFIEAHYGFWMPDEDLVAENIRTARPFAAYIRGPRPARRAARTPPEPFRAGGASRRARGRAQHGDRSPPRAAAALFDPRPRVRCNGAAKRPRRHVVSPAHGSARRTEPARASGSP